MDDITARLKSCFSAVFPNLPDAEISSATQDSVGAWDSVAAITLASVVEDEFNLPLDLEHLNELDSFQRIRQHIESRTVTQ